jgi:hypothetical protein
VGGGAGNVSRDDDLHLRLWRWEPAIFNAHADGPIAATVAAARPDEPGTVRSRKRGRQLDRHARIVRFRSADDLDSRLSGRYLRGRRLAY